MPPPAPDAPAVSPAQKWAITFTVMVVAFMQILDTSVTNVILPHLQGSLSAGLDEVSWVITSYLAANAVVIPATGWLVGLIGRKRLFLICTTLFVASSFLSGAAPDLTTLIVARIFPLLLLALICSTAVAAAQQPAPAAGAPAPHGRLGAGTGAVFRHRPSVHHILTSQDGGDAGHQRQETAAGVGRTRSRAGGHGCSRRDGNARLRG